MKRGTSLGLDIGHHTIKAALVERSGTNYRVSRVVSMPTPVDTVKDGVVIDPKTLGSALKAQLKASGIGASNAHIAVAGAQTFVRPVTFPKMPEATLRKSIRYEAGRYLPGSVDECYVEFEILGDADENNMSVLLVSAPKELVNSRIQACRFAGLAVESVDIEVFASYRALIETDESISPGDETIAFVDIGATGANLAVIDKGVFSMVRSIPVGGWTLTHALMSYFRLSPQDAESGKVQLDVSDLLADHPTENPPLRVLQSHLDDLVREVRRSLNYFQSQQVGKEGQSISRLVITGGTAQQAGLAEYFGKKMSIRTETAGLDHHVRFLWDSSFGPSQEYVTATGLAMRSLARAA